jgi:hypothetical protein
MKLIARLKRLLRRTPTSPQPLPPGCYRFEAWVKTPNTEWKHREKLVEITEPTFASQVGGSLVSEIMADRQDGEVMWFDDVTLKPEP